MADFRRYFTLSVPWVPAPLATEWHPTESAGPFATLTRGSFATFAEAVAWARAHLAGAPYSVVLSTYAGDHAPDSTPDGWDSLLKGEQVAAAVALPPLPPLPPPAPEAPPPPPAPAPAPEAPEAPPPAPEATPAPAPAPALDFGKLSPRAVADARGYRKRGRRGNAPVPFNVLRNHYGLSRDRGHLGPVPAELDLDALAAYARIFRAVCGDPDVRVPDAELPRTQYRIRIGSRWLASLVCKPGGAVLADARDGAGLFDGPVRLNAADFHGPATTTGLARQLLGHAEKVWCEPTDGGPGFWAY
jgi:hypothetical protein